MHKTCNLQHDFFKVSTLDMYLHYQINISITYSWTISLHKGSKKSWLVHLMYWHIISLKQNQQNWRSKFKGHLFCLINGTQFRTCMQGRRRVWKSGGGDETNVVGIICPPGWERVTYLTDLPKSGCAMAPPAPTDLTMYKHWKRRYF